MRQTHITKIAILFALIICMQAGLEYARIQDIHAKITEGNQTTSLMLNLKHIIQLNPTTYVSESSSWEQFKSSAEAILEISSEGIHGNVVDIVKPLKAIIDLQSTIKNQQTEFMRLRSLSDSLDFKISKSTNINELIINSRQGLAGSLSTNKLLYRLHHHLSQLANNLNSFWQILSKQKVMIKKIESELDSITSISTELLDGEHALKAHAERKGMVEISNYANELRNNIADLQKAAATINTIARTHNALSDTASTTLKQLEKHTVLNGPTTLYIILQAIILAALALTLIIVLKNLAPSSKESKTTTALNTPSEPHKTVALFAGKDIDNLLDAIEKAKKGNITSKADDKQSPLRDVAINYNQLMSGITRHLIGIHQRIKQIDDIIGNVEEPKQNTAPANQKNSTMSQDLIEPTFEIAASVDQIERKLKNNEITSSFITSKMAFIDRQQALLRVKLRDHLEIQAPHENSTNWAIGNDIKEQVALLREELAFFKLDRRL